MMELDGQVAIVTGAARGIGFALSQRLNELGARIACWDIAPPLKANGSVFAHAEIVDVTSLASIEAALERTLAALGQADILVNNAGVNGPTVPIQDYSEADWHKVIGVDLTGGVPLLQGGGAAYGRPWLWPYHQHRLDRRQRR